MNELPVSVVMPTYNGSKFIKRAIESILAQTYTNFEFIIVDDGSTDNTAEIIRSYSDSRIKYIYQENKGPAAAYNTGFKNASTEFIFIMDHDDYSFPARLERQLEYLLKNDLDACGTNYEVLNERNGYIERVERSFNDSELKEKLNFLPAAIFNPTVCIKKSTLIAYNFYDESYKVVYDHEFYLRIMDNTRMEIVPDFLFRYYRHNESYSAYYQQESRHEYNKMSLIRLKKNKSYLPKSKYYSYLGFINFYSNHLTHAILFLLISSFFRIDKMVIKYCIIIAFAGPIIKLARKYDFTYFPLIRGIKKRLLPI